MSKAPRHRRPLIEALEPRLLFSATADIAVFDDGHSGGHDLAYAAQNVDLVSIYKPDDALDFHPLMMQDSQADIPQIDAVIFVDTSVDNYQTLVNDIEKNLNDQSVAIVYLDSTKDGLTQISDYLAGVSGISAVHIISHGVAGSVQLGTQVLNENNIAQYQQALGNWKNSLDEDADILLYGCDVAANQSGLNLLRQLSDLTGADVAASNDLTGNAANADWDLEERVGQIETASIFSSSQNMEWQGVLTDVVHLYSGVATHEQAIPTAGYVMQGIQLTSTQTVDRIQVMLANHGTSSASVQVLVHQHSYNGTVVASATVNTASLGSSLGWVNFDFAQTTFNAYTVYWIEFKTNNGADNLVGIGYINSNVIASEFVVNGSGDGGKDMAIALVDVENRAPTVANAIPNQTATEEALFSYTFAANTFNDQDGDTLTYTATLSNGNPLPPWLNFNAATRTFSGVPDDGDVGTITVKVTANDGKGATVDDTFDLVINNINDNPFLNIPVPNQNATEDAAFNYTFPANTFGDGDIGASFTYTATLAGGGALPAWLNFDSATRTFSGTPANGDVGTISVKLTANDGAGGTAEDTFDIVIANTNDAPTVANQIPNQTATENALFNYTFAINTFNDQDVGNTLTYTAQLAGGAALPAWLSFDGATRTFSGTPSNGDVGNITIEVRASDGTATVSDFFDLDVQNVGSSNVVYETSGPSTDTQIITAGVPFFQSFFHNSAGATYTIDSIVLQLVKDPSAAAQTITVTLLSGAHNGTVVDSATVSSADIGTTLAWKAFDFTNTVLTDNQLYFIKIESTSNDGQVKAAIHNTDVYANGSFHSSGGAADTTRDVAFQISSGANIDPVIVNPIPNQSATEDAAFNFQFAANTFNDADVGDTLTYTATMADGSALPAWLSFNAATRTFSGTPTNADVGTISIKITADDGNGGTPATDTFDLVIANSNDAPTVANVIPNQNATEDSVFNFTFAANTFADQDVGNTLSYTAQLAGGGALPAWLSFDSATRTFSGTPTNAFVGTVSIDVIANDGNGGTVTDTFNIVVANTNDAPTVANAIPNQNATEDAAFNFQFAANTFNDQDIGDSLTYSAQLAGGGALPSWLSFNAATRTFSGTPANGDVGSFSVDVIASDGNGGSVTDTFSITVANVNDAPSVSIALTDYYTNEQVAVNLHGTGISISDVDSNNITLTLTGPGGNSQLTASVGTTGVSISSGNGTPTLVLTGTLTQLNDFLAGNNGGTLTYRLAGDTPIATATITISASDGALSGNDTTAVNITAVNDAPVNTVPGAQSTNEDTALVFSAGNSNQIQIGDVDAAAGTMEVTLSVTNGTLTLAGTTGLSFTTGDGTADSTLVFTGTLTDINTALATLTYNPTTNYNGAAVLSITTSDQGNTGTGGTLTDTDTVNITVNATNDAPTVTITPTDYNATEQLWMDLHGTGISVADIDGNPLTITITGAGSNSNFGATAGTTGVNIVSGINTNTLVLSGTAAQLNDLFAGNNGGTFTYRLSGDTPLATRLLTISASDGSLSGNDTATINITAVNDAPENSVPGAQVTNEDVALVFSAGNGNQIQVDDLDVGASDLEVTLSVTNGTLTLAGVAGLAFTTGDGTTDSSMVFRGTQANINAALATLTFNPTGNFTGAAVLSITTSDLGSTGTGGTLTDTDNVNITINGTNDAPTVANAIPNQNATEDAAFNFQFAANTFADIDAGATLTYSAQLNGGGALPAWLSFNPATRTFSGTPANGDVGTISIDVIADDGNGGTVTDTFNIVVANTNDAPTVANAIPNQNATEDAAFNFQFAANTFADPDVGDTLIYSAQLAGGGALPAWLSFDPVTRTFSGTPANANVGTVSIDVIADDGNGGTVTDTFNIVVANSNDAPTVANAIPNQNATQNAAFNFQFAANTFADVDVGATLTYSAQLAGGGALPAWLSFDPVTRTFSGTPTNGDVGTVSIDVIADDGNGGTVTDTFNIVVGDANDAPTVANAIPNQNATEDAAFNFQFAANTFADPDVGDTLTYSAQLAGGGALPAWLSFDPVTRTFSGTPANANVGTVSIDVIADDGNGGTVTDTFNIVIANSNDAPTVANAIPDRTATENAAFNFQFAANTFADPDVGDTLTYSAQLAGGGALPAWLSFNAATRTFSGTPTNADLGSVSIDVIADDGNGGTITDTFTITVNDVNDAPTVANAIPDQNATEDAAFNFQFAANTFADVDVGNVLTYSAQVTGGGALPAWLSFDPVTRTFSGTPANANVGTLSIDVIANDGNGGTVTDTFDIVIANTNDAPTVANPIADQTATENSAFNFQFAANTFADVDVGATLTYSAQLAGGGALPAWLSFDAVTRTFSGTPGVANIGTVNIDVIASDGNGGSITDTFSVTVNALPANLPPVVQSGVSDQSVNEDSNFSFTIPANAFSDAEGDPLSYSVQMVGGGALPAWLSFDAATRTFSGTPDNSDVGVINLQVSVSDGNGGSASDTFSITVINTNDAPTVNAPAVNPVAQEDERFSLSFPLTMFNDIDVGDSLNYSAQLANGQALPDWLQFDAATLTFSGTPGNDDAGTLSIQLIASDGEASVSFQFILQVEPVNDSPVAIAPITINNVEDAPGDQLDLFTSFSDEETPANQLRYSVVSNSNSALVTSATVDANTGKLNFSYGTNQFGSSDLIIRAQDASGATVETAVRINIASVNDVPVSTGINDINVNAGAQPQQMDLRTIFSDIENGTALQYSLIANTNTSVVPNVQWNQATGMMTISFAANSGGETFITLRAQDNDGAWVDTRFKVNVTAPVVIPEPETPTKPPVTPPTVPPVTEVPTTPPVTPPTTPPTDGNGGNPGAGNNGGDGALPETGIDTNLPGTSGQGVPPINDPDDSRNNVALPNDKSSRDYERFEAGLESQNIPVTTLTASSSLVSLIATDDGFAPWEAADFDNEVRRIRDQMDVAMEEEQDRRAVVAGLTFSVTTGLLVWSLRASSLLLTLMSMLPLWRGLDPLPILDEVNKRKKELEQQRKDRAREDKSSKEVGYLFDHAQQKNPGQ